MGTITATYKAPPARTVLRVGTLTTVAALATNLGVFVIARVANTDFAFAKPGSAGGETVAAGAVLAATVLTMTMGWTVVGLAAWRHQPSLRTVAILGGTVSAVSALAPLAIDADLAAKLTLACLHLLTGTFFITGTARLGRADTRAAR